MLPFRNRFQTLHTSAPIKAPQLKRRGITGVTLLSGMTVAAFCMVSPASAASNKNCTQRVKAIIDHVNNNPVKLQSIPMEYEAQPSSPLPNIIHNLQPTDVLPPNLPHTTHNLHYARVIAGLLYLACGGLDHTHNLITPLCWGSYTTYAGSPIHNSPAAIDASYTHALTHLLEGDNIGEFGTGYSNANYWYAATGAAHPIHAPLLETAKKLAGDDAALQKFVSNHGGSWQPSRFVSLCVQSSVRGDGKLKDFCEAVVNAEWRLLLNYCCNKLNGEP